MLGLGKLGSKLGLHSLQGRLLRTVSPIIIALLNMLVFNSPLIAVGQFKINKFKGLSSASLDGLEEIFSLVTQATFKVWPSGIGATNSKDSNIVYDRILLLRAALLLFELGLVLYIGHVLPHMLIH